MQALLCPTLRSDEIFNKALYLPLALKARTLAIGDMQILQHVPRYHFNPLFVHQQGSINSDIGIDIKVKLASSMRAGGKAGWAAFVQPKETKAFGRSQLA